MIITKRERALSKFVKRYETKRNVIGILATGSYATDTMDPNSDIDVHIVLEKGAYRERGAVWIDGIEIEYFINPVAQVHAYFDQNKGSEIRATAAMFASSKVLYEKGSALQGLISRAQKVLKSKRTSLTKQEQQLALYLIEDLRKDLEDVFLRKDWFAFSLISDELFTKCVSLFFQIHRTYKVKPKAQQARMHSLDPAFARRCQKYLVAEARINRRKALRQVANYIERLLGGKITKEWKMRSKITGNSK